MAYQWDIVVHDAPQMVLYNDVLESSGQEQEDGEHTYLTESFLTPTHSIPGIPFQYAVEQIEGRALYLGGAPKGWQSDTVRSIFRLWGTVEKLPVLISLSAETTFRWVVMGNNAEAMMAMEKLHGRKHEHGCLIISMSLPPGRTLTLVKKELLPHQPVIDLYEDPEKTPMPQLFHGHPPIFDTSDEKTPTITAFEFRVEDTDAGEVRNVEDLYSGEDLYSAEDIETPEVQQPSKFSPMASPVKEAAPAPPISSWAAITASANPDTKVIDLKPEQRAAAPRLKPVGRIPSVTRTDRKDNRRLVFLFNLPSTITATDISNAVIEGPLVKIQFGIDDNTKKRFCGVIFQNSHDAAAFQESLDKERRLSKPERFRFIVDHARDEQTGFEGAIKAMGPPMFATRRLTIVKAGFFFMFGERQLKDMCDKLVGEDAVQLIWLYNGGNATIVFTDVSAAIKIKNEFDRRAFRAQTKAEGAYAIWAGVTTTFSKDPCVVPLELKTNLRDF
jgi:hypothetical protein